MFGSFTVENEQVIGRESGDLYQEDRPFEVDKERAIELESGDPFEACQVKGLQFVTPHHQSAKVETSIDFKLLQGFGLQQQFLQLITPCKRCGLQRQ